MSSYDISIERTVNQLIVKEILNFKKVFIDIWYVNCLYKYEEE